ncbi:hypothetical protein HZP56_17660 [Elizabethkingia anophelis]|uniref:Cell wall surface anchor family protein n=2 Tax=Elizabethkingia anophelis TaxID=1117645 RepID=A0A077EH84_9FLAO|nr:hypothetical protein [Elizabethkingia anophelis]AIL46802.1 hypothetical protein BD94_3027 [Elizabethkingia anophelis NUHP1]AKH95381.1 hypothetical protein M876_12470 [Elizabethkingia anophelis FMS-007]MBE9392406.1 hypothetical protein [Elizabethkingia anophelis]MBE9406658.1 hypothetical protein [Elizabethkingia anophelis]MCT3662493.1 hypothetical protein [Elizabethkingia anophelis]
MKNTFLLLTLFTSIGLSAQNLNPVPSIINPGTADTFTGGYTFAYKTSGTPWNGALISFGGFSNNYDTQLSADYGPHKGNHLSFRTRNGDAGVWNNWQELATKGSNEFSGDQNILGNVGIGTTTPQAKLNIYGGHEDTTLLLHSVGDGANAPAYLNLWASEPAASYTGVGIGNNIKHWNSVTPFSRFNNARGASYMRLLENQIVFTTVDATGKFVQALNIAADGNVAVTNKLEAKEIKVTTTPTADFVFENSYQLPDLASVEKHIKEKKHLPEIASAAEMQKEGVNIGDFQIKLLQKIEELTLYSIEQNKQNKKLFRIVEQQQEQIKNLEKNIQQSTNTK